jgi:threonine aldolase
MRNTLVLGRRLHRSVLCSVIAKSIHLRKFTMGSTDLQSTGGNGMTNTWQGLGAAEFDLRSKSGHRNHTVIGTDVFDQVTQ